MKWIANTGNLGHFASSWICGYCQSLIWSWDSGLLWKRSSWLNVPFWRLSVILSVAFPFAFLHNFGVLDMLNLVVFGILTQTEFWGQVLPPFTLPVHGGSSFLGLWDAQSFKTLSLQWSFEALHHLYFEFGVSPHVPMVLQVMFCCCSVVKYCILDVCWNGQITKNRWTVSIKGLDVLGLMYWFEKYKSVWVKHYVLGPNWNGHGNKFPELSH